MVIVEPEDGKSYGMAAVTNWVDEEDFPLTKSYLNNNFGDKEVMLGYDNIVDFSDILDNVEEEEFEEIVDLWRALGASLRQVDQRRQRYETEE